MFLQKKIFKKRKMKKNEEEKWKYENDEEICFDICTYRYMYTVLFSLTKYILFIYLLSL